MFRDDKTKKKHNHNDKEHFDPLKYFSFGGMIIIGLCVLFSVINYFRGQSFNELGAIIFAYISSALWKGYKATKNREYIYLLILGMIGVLVSIVKYFILF